MEDSHKLIGGTAGKRVQLDFYPTPENVTEALLNFFPELTGKRILEPACGDGAMARVLSWNNDVIASDLRDSGYGIPNIDFLTGYEDDYFDAIITNPPFNVADDFIKRSLERADFVGMVLKSQYWHAKKRLRLFNDTPPSYVLPLTWRPDFTGEGASLMDVTWTVWIKGDTITKYQPLEKPIDILS